MFVFLISFTLLLFETHSSGGGFFRFYEEWLNIPGFEAWKFLNLGVFIALAIYIAKKPLSEAFKLKREEIRAELIKAEEEKRAALSKLTTAEGKLAQLKTEKAKVLQKAKAEAAAETKRIAENTAAETERLRQQSDGELRRLAGQSRSELQRFSAHESIRLAEQKIRSQIDGDRDARLVKASIQEIGGLN